MSPSIEEKLSTGLEHKAAGNLAFGRQELSEALRCYHLSILYLSGLDSESSGMLGLIGRGGAEDENKDSTAAAKASLSSVHCNMALIYLKQQKYDRAITAAEKSLKCADGLPAMTKTELKAKYRKAQALRLSGDVYKARDYLNATLSDATIEDEAKLALKSELASVQKTIDARQVQSQNKWKGFLSKKPSASQTTEAPPAKTPPEL